MNRRKFVQQAALAPLVATSFPETLRSLSLPATGAATEIALQSHYDLTLRRVLLGEQPAYTPEFLLDDIRPRPGRRFTEYSGDLSGRYIGALATASRVYGTSFPGLSAFVEQVIALQKPDGCFGAGFNREQPTDNDLALLWGNGRLLVGLTEYYRVHRPPQVFAASIRLGNFLVSIGPLMLSPRIREAFGAQHFASSYICWTQQSEGLANLYALTGDDRYRVLALEIAAATERRAGDHVHGYLTSVRGWVDLYQTTGDKELLDRCQAAWHDVAGSKDLLITGGVPEGWSPNNHRTEGCGEVDWLRLSLGLWKTTGKPEYLEMAERTLFNELLFNQFATGDFGHHVYTDTGLPAAGAARAWWCCTLHGLRCFPDIHESVFRRQDDNLYYDLPLSGEIRAGNIAATAVSTLTENGTVRIEIQSVTSPVSLRIRKPAWAKSLTLRLNGKPAQYKSEGIYVLTDSALTAEDSLTVDYGLEHRKEEAGSGRVSYWFGPWLLGAPAAENPNYFNELTTQNRISDQPRPLSKDLSPVHAGFSVPVAAAAFRYVPAEFPEQPGSVQLRAIAEQSGQPTTSWELRFLQAEKV